ncbi:MAG: protease family protein [Patescibacteria group bacterium]|nr:protease family protein [Patescibacteria group bacterium]
MALILPAWVFVSFTIAQLLMKGAIWLLLAFDISLTSLDSAVLNSILAALLYVITIFITIGTPWVIKKHRTNLIDLGFERLMSWTDILITPASLIVYLILSSVLMLVVGKLLPWIDLNQVQDTGFSNLGQRYEYILAFATLVVIAPIAEEILFRGYLYGKLKKIVPVWVAIILTSLLFGYIHGAWNLAIDTFALSVVLCILREMTGNVWSSILLHMAKNSIAFYILFINPMLLATIVR